MKYNIQDTSKLDFKVGDRVRHRTVKRLGTVTDVHEDYHGRMMMKVVFDNEYDGTYVNDKKYFELESEAQERENSWKDIWDESSN